MKFKNVIKKKIQENINELEIQISKQMEFYRTLPSAMQSWSDTGRSETENIIKELQKKLELQKYLLEEIVCDNEKKLSSNVIDLHSLVNVINNETGKESWYLISSVSGCEIEIDSKKITLVSCSSPIGKSLMGCKKNDCVTVSTPQKTFTLKILEVKHDTD